MAKAWLDLWYDTCNSMMAVMKEAEQFGVDAQGLWKLVQQTSSTKAFGESLRKDLTLSGALFATFQVCSSCSG
jgi:hypothetical protein